MKVFLLSLILSTSVHTLAQCPSGSVTNTAGTFNSGQNICITSNFSGSMTLNNGATMTVINGGNYTGSLTVNVGSTVNVQDGGRLAASSMNTFAGTLNNEGTVVMPQASIATGARIYNNDLITWPSGWNANGRIDITVTACGTMTFPTNLNINNNSTFVNNGTLNFLGSLSISAGTSFTNYGQLYVNGSITSGGAIYNYNKAVFKSGGNLNTGDSIVNTGWLVFGGGVTSDRGIRNEGLLYVAGSWTSNSNGRILINNINAQMRVTGAFMNNTLVQGNGSLHVGGSVNNNNTISGFSSSQRLRVNKVLNPAGAPNTTYNPALVGFDSSTYTAAMAQPAVCNSILPMAIAGLQAAYEQGKTNLQWRSYSANATYFVEFSTDGKQYVTVGELTGTSFAHKTSMSGVLYYRIREMEASGMKQYSNVVAVRTATTATTTEVFPNPFTNNLQVNIFLDKSDVIEVALFNSGGQLIVRQQRQGQAGSNAITVNGLSSLMPGVYFSRITTGNKTVYSKLIK